MTAADKPRNWWMVGYYAAMQAGAPGEFDDALRKIGSHDDHQRDLFMAGRRSVWRCERLHEADVLGERWAAARRAEIGGVA